MPHQESSTTTPQFAIVSTKTLGRPGLILAVDDDPNFLLLATRLLEGAGHSVLNAHSGARGLEIAREKHPDLILLDINMPGMDGFQTCRKIRADPGLKHIPVVLVTGWSDPEAYLMGLESGASDFCTKPLEGPILEIRIRSLLKYSRAIKELQENTDQLYVLNSIQRDIATARMDLDTILQLVVERIQKLTGASGTSIHIVEGENLVLKAAQGRAAAQIGTRYFVTENFSIQSILTGEIFYCDDTAADPRVNPGKYAKIGVRSMLDVPLCHDNKVIGVLNVESGLPNAFRKRDIHALEVIAGLIGAAITHAMEFQAKHALLTERSAALEALRVSEERFRLLVASVKDYAIFMLDPEGRVVSWNAGAERIKGYQLTEILGKNVSIFYTPEQVRMGRPEFLLKQAGAEGQTEDEGWRLRKDGSQFWANVITTAIKDQSGALRGFVKVVRDITDRKHREDELRLLQSITRSVSEAEDMQAALRIVLRRVCETTHWRLGEAWIPSPDGLSLECNASWLSSIQGTAVRRDAKDKLTFGPGQGLPGQVWLQKRVIWVHDLEKNEIFTSEPHAEEMGFKSSVGIPVLARNEVVAVLIFFMSEPRKDDEILTRIITAIAEQLGLVIRRKRAEDALKTLNLTLEQRVSERSASAEQHAQELARSNADLEQFAYVASHDLQEPLRMIASYLELLEKRYKGKLDTKADQYISYAVDGAKRMQGMIRDLLHYSRATVSSDTFKPVDVQKALDLALNNLSQSIKETGAQITSRNLPEIYGEPTQIAQLLQNLIGNAIKFRRDDTPKIQVSAELKCKAWVFAVQDNGIGLETQFKDRIFQIFQRLHEREKYPGSGIGLAIAKKIVEHHRGKIWVDSRAGEGSTFYFSIPESPPPPPGGTPKE